MKVTLFNVGSQNYSNRIACAQERNTANANIKYIITVQVQKIVDMFVHLHSLLTK